MSLPKEELVQDVGWNKQHEPTEEIDMCYLQIRKSSCVMGWKGAQGPRDRLSYARLSGPIPGHR